MSKNVKSAVEEFVKPIVEELGYEYIETEFSKQGKDWVLTVYIDAEGGIDLEDCERVSRAIDPVLDEKDPIEQSYCLCVSSLGLDRPLKTKRDFEKSIGNCVDIKLYKAQNGVKEYSGRLISADGDTVSIESAEGEKITINIKDAAKITNHLDF